VSALPPALDAGAVGAALAVPAGPLDLRVWCVDLDAATAPGDGDSPAPVRARAARFAREVDRRRYLVSQALLRQALGDAARDAWVEGAHGKPALVRGAPHFNLSRREGWAAIAVSATHEVGVDIETLRSIDDAAELAALHFSPRERAAVLGAVGPSRDRAFLQVWTRKEACMKATGLGLFLPPLSFECGAQAQAQLVRVDTGPATRSLWVHSVALEAPVVLSWAAVLR
jgi:4'-phosphopantetheinyl transferase